MKMHVNPVTLVEILKHRSQYYLYIVMHWPTRKVVWLTKKEADLHPDKDKNEWVFQNGFTSNG